MKLMMLSLAGVVAASAMTPVAADAQRWRDHREWHGGERYSHGDRDRDRYRRAYRGERELYRRGYHVDRDRYRSRDYDDGRYWHGRHWGRPGVRTVCRWRYGRYGAVRRCVRVRY